MTGYGPARAAGRGAVDGEPDLDVDLAIVGAGPIGATLACALSGRGLRLALLEACPPRRAPPGFDERSIALAHGSRRMLDALGLWSSLRPTPIHRIQVTDQGRFGAVWLDRADYGVEALGYVSVARELGAALEARLAAAAGVWRLCPARLAAVELRPDAAWLRLREPVAVTAGRPVRRLRTRLLIAADGARSALREQLGLPLREHDFRQHAIVANLRPQRPHDHIAYERFTATGPLALLPLSRQRCSLVWTVPDGDRDRQLALSDAAFLAAVERRFGGRLGRLEQLGRREAYPIVQTATELDLLARSDRWPRFLPIGNAAHTLHPVAGQGMNLGLRDVAALAELIAETQAAAGDIGAPELLRRYLAWRRGDQRLALTLTEGLVRLFGAASPLPRLARSTAFAGLNLLPGLRTRLATQMMGLGGRQPRLLRGLELTPEG